jgi:protein-L-isoaspartate(D-aspartate) O-methyltransferase
MLVSRGLEVLATAAVALAATSACTSRVSDAGAARQNAPAPAPRLDDYAAERAAMVEDQIAGRGVKDAAVLAAMRKVPRHEFVPSEVRFLSYADRPFPIGFDQTISQPYIVALMSELAGVRRGTRVLEIGTGSGYQAAVLSEMGADVYSIEIVAPLGKRAADTLARLGYKKIKVRIGDGYKGWPEAAPFDAILVTAAPPRVPEPLKQQLKLGGRLVIPVGEAGAQELKVLTRTPRGFDEQVTIPVRFVPMTGKAQEPHRTTPSGVDR